MTSAGAAWPQGIIFDLDGTLVDSAADIAAALNEVFGAAGLRTFSIDETKAMIGGGIAKLVARALAAAGVDIEVTASADLTSKVRDRYAAFPAEHTHLYPGAREVLDTLQRQGLALALATNKPTDISLAILQKLDVARYFRAVMGGSSGYPLKPDGAMLIAAASALSLRPAETVMVGDSAADVGAAQAAQMLVLVVAGGYSTRPASQLGADMAVGQLREVPEALETLRTKRFGPGMA